ncbi:NlpC/P60 family protein [Streptomyces scopuliridis]|uniref:NlpC/P60 family protein n=2 Tax=Streptomyces scopuliridis TaxID=452529 RepID=A0ACD4ZMW3_9ACTN|nr:C40 family peptidase [Streptomyces scopuliridis]WSB35099.1 NlpC/P60 family protein [Streptomyces scopuliridis]WSB99356.1 NlpC/P60 family protein [Streptomyces scopuliridis]WSC06943.1 NlpC/P60 family protein [Streptomyces scopuliridis]
MNRRRSAAAAITVVCALAVLASPVMMNGAYAAPGPDPSPASSASAVAPPPVELPPGAASSPAPGSTTGPGKKSLEDIRKEIEALYQKAASATDAYNLAEEETKKQSAEVIELAEDIVSGQLRIDELKKRAGAAARAQYRGGGLPPEAQLVLVDDPRLFLDAVGRIQQGQKATHDLIAELSRAQEDLKTYTADASTQWQRLEAGRVKKEKAKKEITKQIAAAEKLEAGLEKEERARLARLESDAALKAQTAWLGSGALKDINRSSSERGKKAIAFATEQIGKPYVWGAEGPSSYDCSGLTSQAWAAAGRPIPRTSQEQWRLLPRIDIKDMRPGDLIIYHQDASHVGMYIGDGAIVHAPRPGRNVTLAGAGSMRILGVVRPDK